MLTLQQWNCVSCDNETLATKRLKFVAAANNILLYTVYRLREHCYIYDEQAQLKFYTLTINVVTGGGNTCSPTGARASFEIDANPMSFQKWG